MFYQRALEEKEGGGDSLSTWPPRNFTILRNATVPRCDRFSLNFDREIIPRIGSIIENDGVRLRVPVNAIDACEKGGRGEKKRRIKPRDVKDVVSRGTRKVILNVFVNVILMAYISRVGHVRTQPREHSRHARALRIHEVLPRAVRGKTRSQIFEPKLESEITRKNKY